MSCFRYLVLINFFVTYLGQGEGNGVILETGFEQIIKNCEGEGMGEKWQHLIMMQVDLGLLQLIPN